MRSAPALFLVLALAACGSDPDARSTTAENALTAKAVADVDAAMAEARRASPPAATVAPAATAAAAAAKRR